MAAKPAPTGFVPVMTLKPATFKRVEEACETPTRAPEALRAMFARGKTAVKSH